LYIPQIAPQGSGRLFAVIRYAVKLFQEFAQLRANIYLLIISQYVDYVLERLAFDSIESNV
jgi:hypothetical protein